jgi:hypothetical protein
MPDLQSVFKQPGALVVRSLARARTTLNGKRFVAFLRRLMGSAWGEVTKCRRPLGPGGNRHYAGRGRHVCQRAEAQERAGQSQTAVVAAYLNQALDLAGATAFRGS